METESNDCKRHERHKEEWDGEEKEMLKEKITKHPLYEMMLEKHLECLKVGRVSEDLDSKVRSELEQRCHGENNTETLDQSAELDLFMEAYCFALGKLKEVMEEPQAKTLAFIHEMHFQLRELKSTNHPPASAAESVGSSSFSGG